MTKKRAAPLTFADTRKLKRRGYALARVQFTNEAPRIGSGFRFVYVKTGRKWAYLIGREGRQRLPVATWECIKSTSERNLKKWSQQ